MLKIEPMIRISKETHAVATDITLRVSHNLNNIKGEIILWN